jgi:hypothetical protein
MISRSVSAKPTKDWNQKTIEKAKQKKILIKKIETPEGVFVKMKLIIEEVKAENSRKFKVNLIKIASNPTC